MKQKIILMGILALLCFGGSKSRSADFAYDPNLADYKVMATVHTIPGQAWHCNLSWSGGEGQDVVVVHENMPAGMYLDGDAKTFGWTAEPNQIGTHYVNFSLGIRPDPNQPEIVWFSDRCTIVIKVEEWINPPIWQPMCGGN